jgi:tetratricopeptide (TPR) repeat protein
MGKVNKMERRLIRGTLMAALAACLFLSLSCSSTRKEKKIAEVQKKVDSSYYNKGKSYLNEGFVLDAIGAFEKAIKENPDDLKAHYYLAFCYKSRKYTGRAIREFTEVVRINPRITEAHYQLGVLYAESDLREYALQAYEKVLELEPNHPKKAEIEESCFALYYSLATVHYSDEKYDKAKMALRKALVLRPDAKDAKILLKHTNDMLGVVEKPKTPETFEDLVDQGVKYYNYEQYDVALSKFQKAVELQPKSVQARKYLAGSYERKGERKKAVEEYKRIVVIDPDDLDTHYRLGKYYANLGQNTKAIVHYEKVLALNPDKKALAEISGPLYSFYYEQGMEASNASRYREAKENFEKALKVKPDDPEVVEMLSTVNMFLQGQGGE